MVLGKRTREHSSDSNSNCFETLPSDKPISSSPLTTMHQDDVVSGTEAMLRRRKQPKTTPVSSSSNNKMTWTRDDELIILGSIVDYEKETKLSYNSDWDAFYGYVKDFIEAEFSKKQLIDKTRNLKKRFVGNKARCKGREGPSFTNNEDDEIFKMSMIIWDSTNNETECDSNEIVDQSKDVPCVDHELVDEDAPGVEPVNENMDHTKDASYVEHERVDENIDQAKDVPFVEDEPVDENIDQEKDVPFVEDERVDENVDQAKVLDLDKDAPCVEHELVNENMDRDQENDVPCVEHELVNENMDQEEAIIPDKEKSEEDNTVDEFCAMKDAVTDKEDKEKSEEDDEFGALKDALEATTIYQSIGKYQQSVLIENLRNIGAQRRKELADECKALLDEEMKLYAKKLILSAKLASAGDSC